MSELILCASRFYFGLVHAKNSAKTLRETLRCEGVFREIIRCAGFHQLDSSLLVAETGQHDYRRRDSVAPDPFEQLQSIGAGHSKIKQRTVVPRPSHAVECRVCILCLGDIRVYARCLERS